MFKMCETKFSGGPYQYPPSRAPLLAGQLKNTLFCPSLSKVVYVMKRDKLPL